MTSERVTLPSCDHTKLVCPAITWAEREIDRLNAYQDKTAMAWTKLTESQEREIERLQAALKPFAEVEPGYLRIPPEWFERARQALA